MNSSIATTLDLLHKEFPNLNWEGYKANKDHAHGFVATFCGWWDLTVEVLPIGCMARLSGGRSIIAASPNEQGKTLEEVVSHVRTEWDKIAHAMSK